MRAVDCCLSCGATTCLCPFAAVEITMHSVFAFFNFFLCITDEKSRCMTLHFHQETARRLCATYSEVYKNEHTPHKTCNGAQRYGADNCCRLFLSCTELTALCGFGVVDTCYSHSQKENFTIKIGKKVQEKYGIAEKTQLIPTKKNPGIQ